MPLLFLLFFMPALSIAQYPSNIIGDIDFVEVDIDLENLPENLKVAAQSVGRISMGCTGTHVGRGFVVTAGHCFEAPEKIVKDQSCKGIQMRWGYRSSQNHDLIGNCKKILVMQNRRGADYALIKVDQYPEAFVPLQKEDVDFDEMPITLFSHPKGWPLQWSQMCKAQRLNPPPSAREFIYHRCDTYPGSSGAAILDVESMRVIGIHKGGIESSLYGTWNFATPLSETPILDLLRKSR